MDKHSNKKNNTKAKETWKPIGKIILKGLGTIVIGAASAAANTFFAGKAEDALANSRSKKIEHKDNK